MAEHIPGQAIPLGSLPNLRDIGGYPTAGGGYVRTAALYRSTAVTGLHGHDLTAFAALGVRTVIDLRTQGERDAAPDQHLDGTRHVIADVLRDGTEMAPAQLLHILGDPAAAAAALGDGRGSQLFEDVYRQFITLPSATAAYRSFFEIIADGDARPVLFHCTTGKDRTGWAAAATLLLLGVGEPDVRHDFMLTNQQLLPALQPVLDRFAAVGGDPGLLVPALGVQASYLDATLAEMRSRFGSVQSYFADGLGISEEQQDSIRGQLIVATEAR